MNETLTEQQLTNAQTVLTIWRKQRDVRKTARVLLDQLVAKKVDDVAFDIDMLGDSSEVDNAVTTVADLLRGGFPAWEAFDAAAAEAETLANMIIEDVGAMFADL